MPDAGTRASLGFFAVLGLGLGAWATVDPRGYYDQFPGLGHHWISADGPYNQHLMRDYGALNLALGVLAVCALVWLTRPLVVSTALAWLVYEVPHLEYHLTHLGPYSTGDAVAIVAGLAVVPVISVLLIAVPPVAGDPG